MDFATVLQSVKVAVDEELQRFFSEKRLEAQKLHPQTSLLVDQIRDVTLRGGKRTRAFLCWLGHETARSDKGKVISKTLMNAMMGLELFQSFALIHDDIIDEDTVRRGGPTVHAKLGVPMAILAGDLALAWADELMGRVKSQKSKVKSGDIYQAMKQEVIFGQSLDVMRKQKKIGISKHLIDVYKTAWYTVIRPIQIGAAIAGADEKTIASFVPYGLVVGEAYQLRDDFLDGEISEEEFQKKAKKLVIPKFDTMLFTEFAHFVLNRSA